MRQKMFGYFVPTKQLFVAGVYRPKYYKNLTKQGIVFQAWFAQRKPVGDWFGCGKSLFLYFIRKYFFSYENSQLQRRTSHIAS
jgi:hypothetical protein